MRALTEVYELEDINLTSFPNKITLEQGREGGREWWEWRKERQAIIIQRPTQKLPWVIFFEQGGATRTLDLPLTRDDKVSGIIAKTFSSFSLDRAIKALADLGIQATLKEA